MTTEQGEALTALRITDAIELRDAVQYVADRLPEDDPGRADLVRRLPALERAIEETERSISAER